MTRKFALFFALFFSVLLQARNFVYQGINYEITSLVSPFSVSVTSGLVYSGDIAIPENVIYNDTIFKVTSIKTNAFNGNSDVNSISIPNSVNSIGIGAFYGCSGLKSIILSTDNEYFNFIDGILYNKSQSQIIFCLSNKTDNVIIPSTVTTIETGAFYGCNSITSITIPNSINLIKSQAFYNCTRLASVIIGESTNTGSKPNVIIQNSVFDGCEDLTFLGVYLPINSYYNPFQNLTALKTLEIGNSVTLINSTHFSSLPELTTVILGNNEHSPVTISVSVGAFSKSEKFEKLILNSNLMINNYFAGKISPFSKISELIINDKVTSIGNYAFIACENLVKVNIGNAITTIGLSAFADCSKMTEITLGNAVSELGLGVFSGCKALLNILVNDLNSNYSSNDGVLLKKNQQTLIQYPLGRIGAYVIPEQVKTIDIKAFAGSAGLSSIAIPQSTTSILASAFANCEGLKYVYIGHVDSISIEKISISSNAFSGCTNFSNLTYNKEVSFASNDGSPFKNLISIDTVYIGNAVSAISNLTFLGCTGLKFVRIGIVNNLNTNPITVSASAFAGCTNFKKLELNRSFNTSGYDSPFTTLTQLTIGEGVSFIGDNAFNNCKNLSTVTLPTSLKKIGNQAFYYCTQLPNIVIPEITELGSYAFSNCSSLKSIILPNSLSIIQHHTFYQCSALETVQFGNSVTHINESAFTNCNKLTNIEIPNSVKSIGDYAFSRCASISTINLGSSLQSIGTYSFSGCSSLQSIQFPPTLHTIPNFAFENCIQLKELHIPNTISVLNSNAFANCTGITKITIGDAESSSAPLLCTEFPFNGCTSVKTLVLNKDIFDDEYSSPFITLTSLENVTFSKRVNRINTFAFYGCTKIQKLFIPNTVISISDGAFQGCIGLSEIKLPDYIRFIPNQLFHGCTNLKSINIPANVESIGSYAFYNCSSLQAVTIPAKVEIIGPLAFAGCTGLTQISSSSLIPPPVGFNGFARISLSECKLNIPKNSNTLYQSTEQWKNFENIIEKDIDIPTANLDTITHVMKTVNIRAGELSSKISSSELKSILKLTIIGEINSADLSTISSLTSLIFLDMSQAVIVSNTIPASAFYRMNNLAFINLPNSITSIGTRAFEYCHGLIKIKLPDNLTTIERQTFANCENLLSVELPSTLTVIKGSAFYDCGRLFSIKLPTSLTTIEDNVFAKCSGLRSILLPESITSIGEFAFAGCSSLQNIAIPSSINSIEWAVFKDCISLTTVTFPSTLKTISTEVFSGCRKLKSIYMYATQPPKFLYYTSLYDFNRNPLTLYVPMGSLELYRESETWGELNNIVEMTNTDVRDNRSQTIVLYPKNVTDEFQVKGLNGSANLTIFNLKGVVVLSKKIIDNEHISINSLPKGIYIVKIKNNETFIENKIVKF